MAKPHNSTDGWFAIGDELTERVETGETPPEFQRDYVEPEPWWRIVARALKLRRKQG